MLGRVYSRRTSIGYMIDSCTTWNTLQYKYTERICAYIYYTCVHDTRGMLPTSSLSLSLSARVNKVKLNLSFGICIASLIIKFAQPCDYIWPLTYSNYMYTLLHFASHRISHTLVYIILYLRDRCASRSSVYLLFFFSDVELASFEWNCDNTRNPNKRRAFKSHALCIYMISIYIREPRDDSLRHVSPRRLFLSI